MFSINGIEMITQSILNDRLFGDGKEKMRISFLYGTPPKQRGCANTYISLGTSDNKAHLIT